MGGTSTGLCLKKSWKAGPPKTIVMNGVFFWGAYKWQAPPCDSGFSLQRVETVGKMPTLDCGNFDSLPDIEMRNEKKGSQTVVNGDLLGMKY